MTHNCVYHSRKERCLIENSYPVTKHKKLDCKRVKAAEVYGTKEGVIDELKNNGLCHWVDKCTHESEVCPGR